MENPFRTDNVFQKIMGRSAGIMKNQQLANPWIRERWISIDTCDHCKLNSPHKVPILAMDCERIENRYVLCGDRSGRISLFDCFPAISSSYTTTFSKASASSDSSSTDAELDFYDNDVSCEPSNNVLKPLQKSVSCKSAIRTLQWYTVDTGMFFSGSMDGNVHCWNTNTMRIAHTFALGDFIYDSHMSDVASTTSVLAVATKSTQVRLCDLRSGAFSHTLIGHKDEVTAVRWSPTHEYTLATGSKDTSIRIWDIRRPGAIFQFDQWNAYNPEINKKYINAKEERERRHVGAHTNTVTALRYTPNGSKLISAGADERIKQWDTRTGTLLPTNLSSAGTEPIMGRAGGSQVRSQIQRLGTVRSFVVSDTNEFAFFPAGPYVQMYNLESGRLVKQMEGHLQTIFCLKSFDQQQALISAGEDYGICIYLPRHQHNVQSLNSEIVVIEGENIQDTHPYVR